MDIPRQVLRLFEPLIREYGNHVEYIGVYDDVSYYMYNNKEWEDSDVGFPQIVGYNRRKAFIVDNFRALKILQSINQKD